MREPNGGRTHEPSLRELTTDLDYLRELFTEKVDGLARLVDERDRHLAQRLHDRDNLFNGALKAVEEKTALALASSERAVTKSEIANDKRFDTVNEFRSSLSDQAATMLTRAEANAKFGSYEEKFDEIKRDMNKIRDSLSTSVGKDLASERSTSRNEWSIGILVVVILSFITSCIALAGLFLHH
jgi:hypothetical protein